MATFYLDAGTILANLLTYKIGEKNVSRKEIKEYCKAVKERIFESQYDWIFDNVDNNTIDETVERYPDAFMRIGPKIYAREINIRYLNSVFGYEQKIIDLLKEIAENMVF